MQKLMMRIAGEITFSDQPGKTMRKWREIFGINQVELSKHLGVNNSTISDYESMRRKSPGANIIKRFVLALFEIDMKRGGEVIQKLTEESQSFTDYYEVHEFAGGFLLKDFADLIEGEIATNKDLAEERRVYGYTLIDSIKVILDMPTNFFNGIYGNFYDRAAIFTGVSTGRSPLVVIRVSPSKPSAVVLHGIKKLDPLAIKISEKIRVPIITTNIDVKLMREKLSKV